MLIRQIKLENFRQFYGSQVIDLSTNPEKNVTLIHAQNGIGKTTILNSILWCLYEDTTAKFEQREKIVNFGAEADKSYRAAVELFFENNGAEYHAKRSIEYKYGTPHGFETEFKAHKIQRGNYEELPSPVTFINSVIPQPIAKYFFFDGEHAENFSAEQNSELVSRAVRDILGCNLVEQSIDDLELLDKGFLSAATKAAGGEKLENQQRALVAQQARADEIKVNIEELERNIVSATGQKAEIEKKLGDYQASQEIHRRENELSTSLEEQQAYEAKLNKKIIEWIKDKSLGLISAKLSSTSLDFIDEEELRGRLPNDYQETFIATLLKAAKCICERTLEKDSDEWRAVEALMSKGGNSDVYRAVSEARAMVSRLETLGSSAESSLKELQDDLANSNLKVRKLEQEIGECSQRLRGLNVSEITERVNARDGLTARIGQFQEKKGGLERDLKSLEVEIQQAERDLANLAAKNKEAKVYIDLGEICRQSKDALKFLLNKYELNARELIQQQVNDILEHAARKDYIAHISDRFELNLRYPDNRLVPKSQGENQLMSLAFIASLIKYSADRSDQKSEILLPGSVAPLVLDSPFGNLDDEYRVSTAAFIPKLARQVVLLVSRAQGDEGVLSAVREHVGAEYVLISENKEPRNSRPEGRYVLNGKTYITSLFGCDRGLTRVERVR